jgi:transcriptional regulator with XRE-family HTH domain
MFHDNLKRLREEKGLTQAALADAVETSLRNVQNWEQGRRDPSLQTLRELANALGVTLAELMEGEPPVKKTRKRKGSK